MSISSKYLLTSPPSLFHHPPNPFSLSLFQNPKSAPALWNRRFCSNQVKPSAEGPRTVLHTMFYFNFYNIYLRLFVLVVLAFLVCKSHETFIFQNRHAGHWSQDHPKRCTWIGPYFVLLNLCHYLKTCFMECGIACSNIIYIMYIINKYKNTRRLKVDFFY